MSITLPCWVIGTPTTETFAVKAERDGIWHSVKIEVKEMRKNDFADIDADSLELWKLPIPKVTIGDSELSFLESEDYLKSVTARNPLDPIRSLSRDLNDLPSGQVNLIIVQRPPRELLKLANHIFADSESSRDLLLIVHTMLRDDSCSAISPGKSNTDAEVLISDELKHLHTHFWGENKLRVVGAAEIIDLSNFNLSQFNPLFTEILLVREEYRIAYDAIIAHASEMAGDRSIILLTGHPGIGKSFFLLYFLFRRLQEREPVALQINAQQFVILDQRGVHGYLIHAEGTFSIQKGIWTLSNSFGEQQFGPCGAFLKSKAHLLHASSPSSRRWKHWVKQLSAHMYIMDVWSREEFRTLLTLSGLDNERERGLILFDLYGSNIRLCIDILKRPKKEETHLVQVQLAATKFARGFSKLFQELLELDFSSNDVSSLIFTLRPKNLGSRHLCALTILTPFLLKTLAVALSRNAAAQQQVVFTMLNSHPTVCALAGCMFENMAHVFAADPERSQIHITTRTKKSSIPAPKVMISGNDSLRHILPPFHFYWRPREPNFKGVDAVIRHGSHVWALQYTVGRAHRAATEGLTEVRKIMNHISGVTWNLVMVGSSRLEAESARNAQKPTGDWEKIPVYACIMEFGIFDEKKLQQLGELFENVNIE